MTNKTYLEHAIETAMPRLPAKGRRSGFTTSQPLIPGAIPIKEKIRAEFWAELIYKHEYKAERMRFEIKVPHHTPNDLADIVIYPDKDDELKPPGSSSSASALT